MTDLRQRIVRRAALELLSLTPETGYYVNLGIGMPTMMANSRAGRRAGDSPIGERDAGRGTLSVRREKKIPTSSTRARRPSPSCRAPPTSPAPIHSA